MNAADTAIIKNDNERAALNLSALAKNLVNALNDYAEIDFNRSNGIIRFNSAVSSEFKANGEAATNAFNATLKALDEIREILKSRYGVEFPAYGEPDSEEG
jgi:hypothetical protein